MRKAQPNYQLRQGHKSSSWSRLGSHLSPSWGVECAGGREP